MNVCPCFQRALLSWLEEERPRFLLQPRPAMCSGTCLSLHFDGIDPAVECRLHCWPQDPSSYDATVHLKDSEGGVTGTLGGGEMLRGHLLYRGDLDLNVVPGGYAPTPRPGAGEISTTREALWRGCLFEPLLRWVNERLSPAGAVAVGWRLDSIWAEDGEFEDVWLSAARLVATGQAPDSPEWRHGRLVPLRLDGQEDWLRRSNAGAGEPLPYVGNAQRGCVPCRRQE